MKILFISPLPPWPLFSGGQIRAYHLIKALSQKHEVSLLSYIRSDEERQYLPQIKKICKKVNLIKRQYKPWSLKTLIKTLFSTKPLVMNLYDGSQEIIEKPEQYDLIYCECFYLMGKIPLRPTPIFLSEQNIEYLAYQRYLNNLPFFKKIILWLPIKWDLLKMKFWEKKMWQRAKKIIVMSENDQMIIQKQTGKKEIIVIPNGVNNDHFSFKKEIISEKIILFVGSFAWFQNVQAVNWLVKDIFPQIKKEIPNVNLLIVGHGVPDSVKKIKEDGINFDEAVEDIREAYKKASVFVAPLKSGSGTKYKILEAMACEVPVVTTSVGAEGFEGFEETMIVREKTEDLATAAVDILQNPQKYSEMTKRARKMVEEKFDWEIIGEKLEKLVEAV